MALPVPPSITRTTFKAPDDNGTLLQVKHWQFPQAARPKAALWYIPGLGGSYRLAENFLELLGAHFGTIVAMDLRGFGVNGAHCHVYDTDPLGDRPAPDTLTTPGQQLADLRGLASHLHESYPGLEWSVCGISLGAMLATLVLADSPAHWQSLCLLAPAYASCQETFTPHYMTRLVWKGLRHGLSAPTRLPYHNKDVTHNTALLEDPRACSTPRPVLQLRYLLGIQLLQWQLAGALRRLALPTTIVVPGQDRICDPAAMRKAYKRLPKQPANRLLELPEAYHDVLLEDVYPSLAEKLLHWYADL